MDDGFRGIFLALLSAALFGASTPLAKVLLSDIGPITLAGFLYLGAGIGLAAVYTIRIIFGFRRTEAPLRVGEWPWLASAVFAGGLAGPILLMVGLQTTSAAATALLLNLESLFTLLIAWIVFRENVDHRVGLGALAILAGAVILSWQGRFKGVSSGALAVTGACLAWAIDNNLTRKLSAADPVMIVMVKGVVAGPATLTMAFALGEPLPAPVLAGVAGVIGVIGYGVSLICFVLALRHLGTARTGAYFATAPFIGAAIAITALGEPFTLQLATAGALMLFGVYLHITERHDHEHVHEALIHEHRHVHDEHHQHEHRLNDVPCEPHTHTHVHSNFVHRHFHYPDIHHRHTHGGKE